MRISITILYIKVYTTDEVELTCHIELPEPSDIVIVKKMQISMDFEGKNSYQGKIFFENIKQHSKEYYVKLFVLIW